MEQYRSIVMGVLKPVYKALSGKKKKIAACADAMLQWMDQLGFADQFQGDDLYEKVRAIFDKMLEIMPEEQVDATEFAELDNLSPILREPDWRISGYYSLSA